MTKIERAHEFWRLAEDRWTRCYVEIGASPSDEAHEKLSRLGQIAWHRLQAYEQMLGWDGQGNEERLMGAYA